MQKNKGMLWQKIACKTQDIIEKQIRKKIQSKEQQDILLGILLGKDDGIEPNIKENFIGSSLSHLLAVSGMHVAYIITIVDYLFSKLKIGKRKTKMITMLLLGFLILLTNNTPSVRRACIMAGLNMLAVFIKRKSDVINNMAISLLITLMQNPFSIFNTGLILSYTATLGIILLTPIFLPKEDRKEKETWKEKGVRKIKPVIMVSLSAQMAIFPINMFLFHTFSLTFIFSNILVSFIIGMIIMIGFMVCIPINIPILPILLEILLSILMAISEIFSNLPLSQILVSTPHIMCIVLYYVMLLFWIYQKQLRRKKIQTKNRKTIINKCG